MSQPAVNAPTFSGSVLIRLTPDSGFEEPDTRTLVERLDEKMRADTEQCRLYFSTLFRNSTIPDYLL